MLTGEVTDRAFPVPSKRAWVRQIDELVIRTLEKRELRPQSANQVKLGGHSGETSPVIRTLSLPS
jgi:hypothetical protein